MLRKLVPIGLLALCFAPSATGGARPAVGSAESVLPACYIPTEVDTSGWQAIQWFGGYPEPYLIHIPATFRPFENVSGRLGWKDGKRRLTQHGLSGNYTCVPGDPRTPGCTECMTPLGAGPILRVDSSFEIADSMYTIVACYPAEGGSSELRLESPDSSDQRVFLAMIRTIERASALTRCGVLEGRALLPDGTPISLAKIETYPRHFEATTDEAGHFRIEKIEIGQFRVQARAEGYFAGPKQITIDPARTTKLDLLGRPTPKNLNPTDFGIAPQSSAPSGTISGQVMDSDGFPVPYSNILIRGTQLGARSDEGGAFTMAKVPIGTYSLKTRMVGFEPDSQTVVVRADTTVTANFTVSRRDYRRDSPVRIRTYSVSPDSALHMTIRSVLGSTLYRKKVGWPPPIEISIRNDGPDTLVLVAPDGKEMRTPRTSWEAWNQNGVSVDPLPIAYLDADTSPLQQRDVMDLRPGQEYRMTWAFPADRFKFSTGRYRLAFKYENSPRMRLGGMLRAPNDADAVKRLRGSTPCKLVSNMIEVEIK